MLAMVKIRVGCRFQRGTLCLGFRRLFSLTIALISKIMAKETRGLKYVRWEQKSSTSISDWGERESGSMESMVMES